MKVMMPRFMDEALEMKSQMGDEAKVLAGGQSLSVLLQKGLVSPEAIIYLGEIEEMADLAVSSDEVRFGAMVTSGRLEHDPRIKEGVPLLAEVCAVVASPHVRSLGTVVGNMCHAEVGSDPPQALLALDAEIRARSARGDRWIPATELIQDFFQTSLEEDEIATEVRFTPFEGRAAYFKHRVRSMDLAVAAVAVAVRVQDGRIADARFAVGGAGPRPLRAFKAEAQLRGLVSDEAVKAAAEVAAAVADEADPSLSDAFGTAEYRKRLVRVSARRGIHRLLS